MAAQSVSRRCEIRRYTCKRAIGTVKALNNRCRYTSYVTIVVKRKTINKGISRGCDVSLRRGVGVGDGTSRSNVSAGQTSTYDNLSNRTRTCTVSTSSTLRDSEVEDSSCGCTRVVYDHRRTGRTRGNRTYGNRSGITSSTLGTGRTGFTLGTCGTLRALGTSRRLITGFFGDVTVRLQSKLDVRRADHRASSEGEYII